MPDIRTDQSIMNALGRQMTRAVQRESVASSNLANLDTPGYRTKEIKFDDSLDQQLGADQLTTTNPRHIGGGIVSDRPADAREVMGLESRRDGNNVQLDRELLAMNRAAGDFTAAQTILAAKFRLVRYAINEGR